MQLILLPTSNSIFLFYNLILLLKNELELITVTHFLIPLNVSGLSSIFLSLESGPSASTARHFENISQYPCVFEQAEPGLSIKPVAFRFGLNNDSIVKESTHILFVNSSCCFFFRNNI